MVKTTITNTDVQEFNIKPTQTNLIYYVTQHHQAIMAAIISSIAGELGYNVTERTQFELSKDGKTLKIHELEPETVVKQAL